VTGIILDKTQERIRQRAHEHLLQKNASGIGMLISSIGGGRQNKKSGPLQELLHGFLRELDGNIPQAKQMYTQLVDGPYKKDALDRLLALALAAKDYPGAVPVLAQLSAISNNYLPALADVLHIIGESSKAIDLYTDYLLLHPDDLQSMYKLGKIYQQLGYRDGVEYTANYILQQDPANKAARLLLQS
jgi:lipopolysaccharide biosynthesis regulator YciM